MNTILLIDDNIQILDALATMIGMQMKDCAVLKAGNGAEGIAIIDSMPVQCILTDLEMPVMDGYGVINYRSRNCPRVPLFVMSGSLSPEVRRKLLTLDVSGCIEKPFFFDQIWDKIAGALNIEAGDSAWNNRPRLQAAVAEKMARA